jgi:hypothetical protein
LLLIAHHPTFSPFLFLYLAIDGHYALLKIKRCMVLRLLVRQTVTAF